MICPYCELAFEPHHRQQIYCSRLCGDRLSAIRRYRAFIEARGPLPTRFASATCPKCKTPFQHVYRPGRPPKFCPPCFATMKPYSRGPRKCDQPTP